MIRYAVLVLVVVLLSSTSSAQVEKHDVKSFPAHNVADTTTKIPFNLFRSGPGAFTPAHFNDLFHQIQATTPVLVIETSKWREVNFPLSVLVNSTAMGVDHYPLLKQRP